MHKLHPHKSGEAPGISAEGDASSALVGYAPATTGLPLAVESGEGELVAPRVAATTPIHTDAVAHGKSIQISIDKPESSSSMPAPKGSLLKGPLHIPPERLASASTTSDVDGSSSEWEGTTSAASSGGPNAPWDDDAESLPIAYRFMGMAGSLCARLSSHLVGEQGGTDMPSSESDGVSTWNSWKTPSPGWVTSTPSTDASTPHATPISTAWAEQGGGTSLSSSASTLKSPHFARNGAESHLHSLLSGQRPESTPVDRPIETPTATASKARSKTVKRPASTQGNSSGSLSAFSDMLSDMEGSYFATGLRSKLTRVLPALIATIPPPDWQHNVMIAEYGCLNSRAMGLIRVTVEQIVANVMAVTSTQSAEQDAAYDPRRGSMIGLTAGTSDLVNVVVFHTDGPDKDFLQFRMTLDTHRDSYLNSLWQSSHVPPLQDVVYPMYVARPFNTRIVPPNTLHFGFHLMDMHWIHAPISGVRLANIAHAEFVSCLRARAREFRRDGVFVLAFIARSESDDDTNTPASSVSPLSPPSATSTPGRGAPPPTVPSSATRRSSRTLSGLGVPPMQSPGSTSAMSRSSTPGSATPSPSSGHTRDIWSAMSEMIVPGLQRLVSCGMIKVDVAREMLLIPMHPRTRAQTKQVLDELSDIWALDWSYGLGRDDVQQIRVRSGEEVMLASEPNTLRVPHPAWLAYQSGKISETVYHDHILQMVKNLYEAHFRAVLSDKGRLSKGAAEFVLDSLWDVLHARMEDVASCPLAGCEMELQIMALRRR